MMCWERLTSVFKVIAGTFPHHPTLFTSMNLPFLDLVSNPSKPLRQTASLTGMDKGTHRPGNISFTAGFYPKLPPTTSLRTDGFQSSSIPASVKDDCKFKDVRGTALNDLEAAVLVTPPDPAWPSGILSVQVHEIRELKYRDNEGTFGREKGLWKVGQSNAGEGEEEEAEGLPSSYCVVCVFCLLFLMEQLR
jgi:Ca2+-dependent lipid-binding protein